LLQVEHRVRDRNKAHAVRPLSADGSVMEATQGNDNAGAVWV
jgi:hypothetical protein